MFAQQPVTIIGYCSRFRNCATLRPAISTSSVNSAKAGRVCRSCGDCQLLPGGTLGRGAIILSISALSLALSDAASETEMSSTHQGVGNSSLTCCLTFTPQSLAGHLQFRTEFLTSA